MQCVVSENIHTPSFPPPPPYEGDWTFPIGGGVPKNKNFKEMYEVELKFPEGLGGLS